MNIRFDLNNKITSCPVCGTGRILRGDTCVKCGESFIKMTVDKEPRHVSKAPEGIPASIRLGDMLNDNAVASLIKAGLL